MASQRVLENLPRGGRVNPILIGQLAALGEQVQRIVGQMGQQAGGLVVGDGAVEVIAQQTGAVEFRA
jgi:hypothetical protein